MIIWFKHLFGLCEEPKSFKRIVTKFRLAEPGDIISLNGDEMHWYLEHTAFCSSTEKK